MVEAPTSDCRERSDEPSNIGLFFRELPTQSGYASRPLPGRLRRLARINEKMKAATASSVVGAHVAARSLIEALMRHGTANQYELFVLPESVPPGDCDVTRWTRGREQPPSIRVRNYSDLFRKTEPCSFSAWFDPIGLAHISFALRGSVLRKLYPVVSCYRTYNHHLMVHPWVLGILLADTQPCDSMVCGSATASRALSSIFEHVAAEFNGQFGTSLKYRGRFDLIPSCVDTDQFKPRDKASVRRQFALPKDALVLLYLGRLSVGDKTDVLPLIRVLRDLVEANPERNLLLVLAGPDRKGYAAVIKKYASSLHVLARIRMLPRVPYESRHLLHAAADIFVCPADNIREVFPLTPLEAMASGVPQVVADWGGYRDSVRHGTTGFLVPTYWTRCDGDLCETAGLLGWVPDHLALAQSVAFDLRRMREYLQVLIKNDHLRAEMGRHSREQAVSMYGYKAVVGQYESLWKDLVSSARRLSVRPSGARYKRPKFYDMFSHYASVLLNDETRFHLTAAGHGASAKTGLLPPCQEFSDFGILQETLLRHALERLIEHSPIALPHHKADPPAGVSEDLTMGDLVRDLASPSADPHLIRRHIMWLVKYGLIEPSWPMSC